MKIMTFNTQHCQSYIEHKINFEMMAEAIKACGADIVGLNEMYGEGNSANFKNQTGILSELTGLRYSYFAKAIELEGGNPYGNALLSRYKITESETIPIPDPASKTGTGYYETRCILKAKLENSLTVIVTHFGLNADEQRNAVETVMANLESEKCILMGDFNVIPDSEILKPLRERMKDAAALFEKPLFSFPSDAPKRKIDYIFVTSDIEIVNADIPAVIASDHRPHTAEIKFRTADRKCDY